VARLLVSVRNEAEARAALEGGAAIVDVKEPSRGPLGMASCSTWRRVRGALPPSLIVSVALGELMDWSDHHARAIPGSCWRGIDFRKIGLAGASPSWRDHWRGLRHVLDEGPTGDGASGRPNWVAVAYLDWEAAHAPEPLSIIGEAAAIGDCTGVLFDTWDKSRRSEFDPAWGRWIRRAKEAGRFVAVAGSLDEAAIRRLRPLSPDIFAVRGAACRGGDRNGAVDRERVARLVEAASWHG
jgi:(5-formylfuran-3-yl)methyl phosphate synthase